MEKIFFLTLVRFFFLQTTNAQTFTVVGNDSMIQNVIANDISVHDIWLQNQTAGDDTLGYQVTQLGLMNGWDASLCVNGNCQIGVPLQAGVMDPIPPMQQGLMGFNVNPYFQSGSSYLEVKVWDIHDSLNSNAALYWQLTLQPNSINEELRMTNDELKTFPNPTLNEFRISNFEFRIGDVVSVYDLNGKLILNKIISSENSVDVTNLSSGIFFIETKNSAGEISRGKFVKQ